MAIPIPTTSYTTSHYELILGTYDRMIITVIVASSRHSGSVCSGLDQIILDYKIITIQILIVKSSSLFYEPIYTIHTIMPSRVWALRATWTSYHVIPRDWVIHIHTWANRGELYELIIRQHHLHVDASLPGVSYFLYIQTCFPGVSYWLQMSQLVIDLACAKVRHRPRSKGCITFDLKLITWRCLAFNPNIDVLSECAVLLFSANLMSSVRFLLWTISHVFMQLGDYSPCVGTL